MRSSIEPDKVMIDCPVHLTHKVPLYTFGHKDAGIWECDVTGVTDACPHYDTRIEEATDEHPFEVLICVLCGVGKDEK